MKKTKGAIICDDVRQQMANYTAEQRQELLKIALSAINGEIKLTGLVRATPIKWELAKREE
jgi:hypothetical protein